MLPLRPIHRALRNGAAFALALAGGCAMLRAWAPAPAIPQVSAKLAQFAAEAPACDVLFFGSSKIYSGLIPEIFDAKMRERGVTVRSYNLGVDGMGFPESEYLAEQALRRRPGAVRWIFLELAGLRTTIPAGQRGTQRQVYWHDVRRTLAVCRQILANRAAGRADLSGPEMRELLQTHLTMCVRRFTNLGQGAQLLSDMLAGVAPPTPAGRDAFDPAQRGYFPIVTQISDTALTEYQRDLEKFRAPRKSPDENYEAALRKFADCAKKHGATVVFLVAPNPTPSRTFFPVADEAPPVLAFDTPQQFPTLYEAGSRGDAVHLNDTGARVWSALLAEQFAILLTERRQTMR